METNLKNLSSRQLKQIAHRLDLIYDGDPWYGPSIRSVLKRINPDEIFDSPDQATHSIAELVAHMIAWRTFAQHRLRGQGEFLPDQEASFNWRRFSTTKKTAWKMLLEQLQQSQQALLQLLKEKDDSLLERQITGKPYTFQYLLTGIVQHDIYHLGQIVYIRKMHEKNSFTAGGGGYNFKVFSYEHLSFNK